MRDLPKWAQALNIPAKTFEEWRAIAPDAESFIFWLLQSGRLSPNDYFQWAQTAFELPLLSAPYFQLEPNLHLWNQIHTVANWSPWMLPIEQWDGVLFIACVEPPKDAVWSFPVRYVLADATHLSNRWRVLHEPDPIESHTRSLIRPERTTTTTVTPPAQPRPRVMEVAPEPKRETPVQPTGFDAFSLQYDSSPESDLVTETPPTKEAPDGFSFEASPSSSMAASGFDALDIQINSDINTDELVMPGTAPAPKLTIAAEPRVESPDRGQVIEPKYGAGTVTRAMTIEPLPALTLDAGEIEAGSGPERIEDARTPSAALAWCFRQLKTRFSSTLVLVSSPKGLQVWKWDANVTAHTESAMMISFDGPSLFRVAARTHRPYHGFVVENPVHKAFFKNWGYTALPKHVTAIPVMINGNFRGLFICVATDQTKALDVLEFAEMTIDKTIQQISTMESPLHSPKAA